MIEFKEYIIKRFDESMFKDLVYLFEMVHPGKFTEDYFKKKFNVNYIDKKYLGYMAFAQDNEPAAFYGAFPCYITNGKGKLLACQSGDTITNPKHQKKGLFIFLANTTYQLAVSESYSVIFGFPNINSAYGFFNKLNWNENEKLNKYTVKYTHFNHYGLCHKIKILLPFYRAYINITIEKLKYNKKGSPFQYSQAYFQVERDQNYIDYKLSYSDSHIIEFEGFIFWFKFSDGLLLGNIGEFDLSRLSDFKKALKKLSAKLGVNKITALSNNDTHLDLVFKDWTVKQESEMVSGSLAFNSEKPINIKYSLSDSDTF